MHTINTVRRAPWAGLLVFLAAAAAPGCADQPSTAANRTLGAGPPVPRQAIVDLVADPNLSGRRTPTERSDETVEPNLPSPGLRPGAGACASGDALCVCEYFVEVASTCGPVLYAEESPPYDDNIEIHFDASACGRADVQTLIRRYCRNAGGPADDCSAWIPLLDCLATSCDFEACISRGRVPDPEGR